jgi:hypothetical protein
MTSEECEELICHLLTTTLSESITVKILKIQCMNNDNGQSVFCIEAVILKIDGQVDFESKFNLRRKLINRS